MEMVMKFWCTNPTKAARRYQQRMGGVMLLYLASLFAVTKYVRETHPVGTKLFLMASVPALDVIVMLAVVGMYLREEVDEFKRYQLVVSILWATAVTLATSAVADFLRSYGAMDALPPLAQFTVFWVVMALAQVVQSIRNRARDDDEPAA